MSNQFIKKQLDFIVTNVGLTDIYEIDKIRYGLEVFYGETSKIIIMVLIALLLDKLPAFILMITLLTVYKEEDILNCSFGRQQMKQEGRRYDIVKGGQAFYHKLLQEMRAEMMDA